MKTIEINLYTPKEICEMAMNDVERYGSIFYGWWKSRKIRKVYGITRKTVWGDIKKMSDEDKEKFVACFPECIKDNVYYACYGRRRATTPPGEFR